MTRYRITVEYDGRPFVGWQRQEAALSVQGVLEAAIQRLSGETVVVTGAGRTDAGVHAAAMVAHFDLEKTITPFRLAGAINAWLRPHPVAVLACEPAPGFHARFDCSGRRYRYHIVNRRAPLTHLRGLAWHVAAPLDAAAMHLAAQRLVGRHDFTTFRSTACQSASPVKTLDSLDVERAGDDIFVHAAARSFLHHQVRSMTGALLPVGRGRWGQDDIARILKAANRALCPGLAPPWGLYLAKVDYPER
jgi:tRNA pseudouridine38-40 synthase